MTIHTPPWCLQWSSDGELTRPDRQDLLKRIVDQEQGLAQTLLSQILRATAAAECHSTGMAGPAPVAS